MSGTSWWIAALLRLYPREYRERHAGELAHAMQACCQRKTLAGASAIVTALRIAGDAVITSILIRRDARRALPTGSVSLLPQHSSPRRGDPMMQSIQYDVRHAFRMLRRAPLFSALVVATLALAIGANTAIFGVVNGVLLRSLPYADPERLVFL